MSTHNHNQDDLKTMMEYEYLMRDIANTSNSKTIVQDVYNKWAPNYDKVSPCTILATIVAKS